MLLKRTKKGFTLIELLVVVLILAILMAVALPLYLNAISDSETKTCRANLQTIANAVQAKRVATRTAYASIAVGAVDQTSLPDLTGPALCPTGAGVNDYSVTVPGTGGAPYMSTCPRHGNYRPGVDNF